MPFLNFKLKESDGYSKVFLNNSAREQEVDESIFVNKMPIYTDLSVSFIPLLYIYFVFILYALFCLLYLHAAFTSTTYTLHLYLKNGYYISSSARVANKKKVWLHFWFPLSQFNFAFEEHVPDTISSLSKPNGPTVYLAMRSQQTFFRSTLKEVKF